MSTAYSTYAAACSRFYELTAPAGPAADLILAALEQPIPPKRVLFVGGMFAVAEALLHRGFELVIADFSREMIEHGRRALPSTRFELADLAALPFREEFDLVIVPGRVFTHMLSDAMLESAVRGVFRALRPEGRLFADNYQDDRIRVTPYFNGTVEARSEGFSIRRFSTTEPVSGKPLVVRWNAHYQGELGGEPFSFADSLEHRAFARTEFAAALERAGFRVLRQGDNFDETSFFTAAVRGE